VDVTAGLTAPCSPAELFALVDDLSIYPSWLDLISRAVAEDGSPATWIIDLRASVGPFARSKRLRMVRSEHDQLDRRALFVRRELDGRRHSPWVLEVRVLELPVTEVPMTEVRVAEVPVAEVAEVPMTEVRVAEVPVAEAPVASAGSELQMHLHYGGKLWTGGVLERALSEQIEQGRERLLALTRPMR
jgi:hypothetical protein